MLTLPVSDNKTTGFKPLYFEDKLIIVNPSANVGVITLWSLPRWVYDRMSEAGIDLSPDTSPVVAVGALYGNGLPELLRNLLYNPQINALIIAGKDRSNSARELINFFEKGLEEVELLGDMKTRIIDTDRLIDNIVTPDVFENKPRIINAGDLKTEVSMQNLKSALSELSKTEPSNARRIEAPLPEPDTTRFPSNPRNHNITAEDALTAWREIIFRLTRFGHVVHLRKGDRMELQNVKAVIRRPDFIDDEKLKELWFDPAGFKEYYDNFLNPHLDKGQTYTYGYRLTNYFSDKNNDSDKKVNTIDEVINNLKKDPEDRKSYVTLWDSGKDIAGKSGHPCLVSLYFRKFDNRLTLTATFRTHNSLDAWLENFYGLLKVLHTVSEKTGVPPGEITVISHSISVDPRRWDLAETVADKKKFAVNEDPNGNFSIEIHDGYIIARHFHKGAEIDQYKGKKASRIQHELYRNCAVSDVNHAIYLGRMLERAERCLKQGVPFIQE